MGAKDCAMGVCGAQEENPSDGTAGESAGQSYLAKALLAASAPGAPQYLIRIISQLPGDAEKSANDEQKSAKPADEKSLPTSQAEPNQAESSPASPSQAESSPASPSRWFITQNMHKSSHAQENPAFCFHAVIAAAKDQVKEHHGDEAHELLEDMRQSGKDTQKHRTAMKHFERNVFKRVAQVAKGVNDSEHPIMLQTHQWLEATDVPKHRYGASQWWFYEEWNKSDSKNGFRFWLDEGEGKDIKEVPGKDGASCTREFLESQSVKYCTDEERAEFLVEIKDGILTYKNQGGVPVQGTGKNMTPDGKNSMMIYVMSPKHQLYVGEKSVGRFHHSSFLAGASTSAAGSMVVDQQGKLLELTPHSGHYRPSAEDFDRCIEALSGQGIDMTDVKKAKPNAPKNLI